MSNVLKMPVQNSIQNLAAHGWSVRRIARELRLNRRTVARYLVAASKCTTPVAEVTTGSGHLTELAGPGSGSKCPTSGDKVTTGSGLEIVASSGPAAAVAAAASRSKCGALREVIVPLFEKGLTAQRIFQDLRVEHAFTGAYESVKRFLAGLRAAAPLPVQRVEAQPGEEMQVDFGLGAPVVEGEGKGRRTWVFRSVLSHSRKGYSESVFHQDTETFLRVIENSLRHYGGVPLILNLDNLKAAVIKADWVAPELNPKIMAFCQHYGLSLLPCRPRTPQHKGKVEQGVAYVQSNALKGLRFTSLAAQNAHLIHWEKNVADTKLHGTTRRTPLFSR